MYESRIRAEKKFKKSCRGALCFKQPHTHPHPHTYTQKVNDAYIESVTPLRL